MSELRRALTIRPRFPLTSWPAVPGPNEVRYALSCGARVRVVITVDAGGCRCAIAHAPRAEQIAGEVWLSMQGLDEGPPRAAAEGGDHAR
jgi:hypothetical protein